MPASWWHRARSCCRSSRPAQDSGKQADSRRPRSPGPNRKQAGRASDRSESEGAGQSQGRPEAELLITRGPTGPLPERPARVVTPPSMTPADLDGLIKQFLATTAPKVEPATLTSDVEFVRRIYFDVIGHPPTPMQVESFLHDHGKDKRARLIETLLASPEYARNWANYWREVIGFHATNENLNRVRFDALEDWLAKRLAANTPWDTIVAGMITATGRNDENGAVALSLAHEARPVEMAGEVSRIFMGVQIQCAQCHDHKTDSWKRRQFHEFAAFFAGTKQNQVQKGEKGQLPVFAVVAAGAQAVHDARARQSRQADPDRPQVFPRQLEIEPGTGTSGRPGGKAAA